MRFGAFQAVSEIGRGGMGVVYKGHAVSSPEQLVAIKVVVGARGEDLDRFEREQRLLATLGAEEGFVPLLAAGHADGRPYLVMPFLAGGTLEQRLRRGPLPVAEAVALGRELALALQRAHERGIVHRDMKPANVLFHGAGPLIADLGLAKHFRRDLGGASQSRSLSQEGMASGTAGYMSPEQLDDAKNATPASDVFSLGVILFECLAGTRPFGAKNLVGYAKAMQRRAPSVRALRADVPVWLARAIAKAIEVDPRERFADARELARALEAPAAGASRSLVVAVAVLAVLAVAGGAAFARWPGARSATPPPPVPVRSPAPPPPPKAPPPGASKATQAQDLLEEAMRKVVANDHAGALSLVERAVELDPENEKGWIDLGVLRGHFGDSEGELVAIERALKVAPKSGVAWAHRGVARAQRKDHEGALEDLSRAISLEPSNARHWYDRGVIHLGLRDNESALADFSRAIEIEPTKASALCNRAALRHDMGDLKGELADLDRAIASEPTLPMLWLNRGLARRDAGDVPAAISDLERWLELDPESPQAARARGLVADLKLFQANKGPR